MLDESSKANYQPWRQEEFNADIRVRKMTSLCRWIYKTLLQEAWVCSTRPYLPADDEQLWMLSDCDSLEQWLENKQIVLKMFEKIEVDGVPLLLHKRIQADWDRLLMKRGVKTQTASSNSYKKWKSEPSKETRSQRLAKSREKGSHDKEVWSLLVDVCGNRCVSCETSTNLCKDHIEPIYQGGDDSIYNLQPLCRSCNSRKGPEIVDKRPVDWEERLQNVCKTSAKSLEWLRTPAKESKEKEKLKESESTEPAEDGGQENESMKATKQIPILCQTILG